MKSVKVVPNIIRALGTIPKRLEDYLRNINTGIELATLQRTINVSGISKDPPKSPFEARVACCDLLIMGLRFSGMEITAV